MTERTNAFISMFNQKFAQESNKSKSFGLCPVAASGGVSVLSAANKLNRVQQSGVCGSKCTTDVVRPVSFFIAIYYVVSVLINF